MPRIIYPWAEWFGRGRFRLRRGRDYDCSTVSMAGQIRDRASADGLSVSIEEIDDGLVVEVKDREAAHA